MKHIAALLLAVLLSVTATLAQLRPIVDSIPMSDGRKLAADVYIPSGMTQGPVILIQTPYNRLLFRLGLPLQIKQNLNSSNYIFVIADWRGFYGSAAAAYPGAPQLGDDGYSTVEWIAQQSWSNGKVGTWGASALGRAQFQTEAKNPPHLLCICPLVAAPVYSYEEYYPNGVLRTEYLEQLDALGYGLKTLVMNNQVHNTLWTFSENTTFYPDSIFVPCFMQGGWYDHTIDQMMPFFAALQTQSPASSRGKHRLLMGPWSHGTMGDATVGEMSYPNAEHFSDSLALLFFDYHLRNISNSWDQSPIVQYYQMGDNTWQTNPAWPLSGTTNTNLYLQATGILNTTPATNNSDSLSYQYDPTDPSPTIGGPTLRNDLVQGPYNQALAVESRNDLLVFTTDALLENVVMKGNAEVHLKVSSNRLDTDFDVRLTDVYPDGKSMLVNDGAFRMRFRNGNSATDTSAIVPGQIYDATITLPATAITFLAGHKIRLDVSSSNYPRFNRNMNTSGPQYPNKNTDTLVNALVATNTVYTNSANSSYITLPLVGYTGITEFGVSAESFNIYPNPATTIITLAWAKATTSVTYLKVYDIAGNEVMNRTVGNNSTKAIVDVSQLPNGAYVAKLISNNTLATVGKFTVAR